MASKAQCKCLYCGKRGRLFLYFGNMGHRKCHQDLVSEGVIVKPDKREQRGGKS